MHAIAYSTVRASLSGTMDAVVSDHKPIIITRRNKPSVVMLSLDDYQALEETAYLLRNPKNAAKLMQSIEQLERGAGQVRELIE